MVLPRFFFPVLFFVSVPLTSTCSAQGIRSVWDGVYTDSQAARGEETYTAECSRCHREDLSGYGGVLTGVKFMDRWREDSLVSFFRLTRDTMPRNAPKSLAGKNYVDIVAFILKSNGFPAGREELTEDSVGSVRVQGREGPAAVPDFSLVSVVGCLSQAKDGTWIVSEGSEPVRTRNPQNSTAGELRRFASLAAGTHRFSLMDPASLQANPPAGHRVEVKGFLIRKPDGDVLNPTSLQPAGEAMCPRP